MVKLKKKISLEKKNRQWKFKYKDMIIGYCKEQIVVHNFKIWKILIIIIF